MYKAKMPVWGINQDCYIRQAGRNPPRKAIKITPGTIPTTAVAAGRDSMPLLTISAIMRTATSGHDRFVLDGNILFIAKDIVFWTSRLLDGVEKELERQKEAYHDDNLLEGHQKHLFGRCRKTMWFKVNISRTAETVLFVVAHVAHVCHFSCEGMF